jgi:transcription antitermination protein NusB
VSTRRAGREAALQFLYQMDVCPRIDVPQALDEFFRQQKTDKAARAFATELVRGTLEHRSALDTKIRVLSENWELERLAVVDRNILRLAAYEMLHRTDIPPVVSINEAVELAKHFSTDESGRFVNGVLDRLKKEVLRPARHAAGN